MNFTNIKKITYALTLALGLAGVPSLSSLSTVQAQGQPRTQTTGQEHLKRQVSMMERSAFREGYRRGWEDSRARRRFDYNRSRLYRMGDHEYRDIFRRGYYRGR